MIEFEYDENKSIANKEKHGINFKEAQSLWQDPNLLAIPAKETTEKRYLIIAKTNTKHYTSVVTFRRGKTRIISVRRARNEEVKLYESQRI